FGTAGAAIKGIVDGLNTHNAALVTAGAEVLHDNAADVAGNNIPLNGGTYNVDGQTIADALSTATPPLPQPPLTSLVGQTSNQVAANAQPTDAAAVNGGAQQTANAAPDAAVVQDAAAQPGNATQALADAAAGHADAAAQAAANPTQTVADAAAGD